jgi:AraC-like DNA-binding protein
VTNEQVRRWRPRPLPGVEVLHVSGATQDWRSLCEDYVLVVNLSGHYERLHRGTREQGGPGSLALCQPGETYTIRRLEGAATSHMLLIDPAQAAQAALELGHSPGLPTLTASHAEDPELLEALRRLHRALATPGASALELETHHAACLRLLMSRYVSSAPAERTLRSERHTVRRVRELLEQRLEENVSLSDLAHEAGLSRFHLLRLFREQVGFPPHAYQLQLRIARARRLLQRGMELAQVAAQVGFADQSHLTRHFKKLLRLTPGQYARACGVAG